MHYLYPFLASQFQVKVFVTILSGISIAISTLYIAYSSRCLHLLRQSSVYNLGYKRDPLLSFILFYGIWAILTQTLNLIELWKEELIPLAKNIKWWTIWWLLFMNSGFAYSCAIGEAGNENLINRIDILAQSYLQASALSHDAMDYYNSWIIINRFSRAILTIHYLLGLPALMLLMAGLVLKIKSIDQTSSKLSVRSTQAFLNQSEVEANKSKS